jgi:hypothetical protein
VTLLMIELWLPDGTDPSQIAPIEFAVCSQVHAGIGSDLHELQQLRSSIRRFTPSDHEHLHMLKSVASWASRDSTTWWASRNNVGRGVLFTAKASRRNQVDG